MKTPTPTPPTQQPQLGYSKQQKPQDQRPRRHYLLRTVPAHSLVTSSNEMVSKGDEKPCIAIGLVALCNAGSKDSHSKSYTHCTFTRHRTLAGDCTLHAFQSTVPHPTPPRRRQVVLFSSQVGQKKQFLDHNTSFILSFLLHFIPFCFSSFSSVSLRTCFPSTLSPFPSISSFLFLYRVF